MEELRPVLVTGARSPAALDIARDMAAAGHAVHMADSSPARISRWSRIPAAVHRIRPPVQDPEGFRDDVADLVRRIDPILVVPTCEEVFHLSAARADGVDVGPLFAPDPRVLDVLHAKDRFADLVRDLGLAVPHTRRLDGHVDVPSADLPHTVLKACYSRFGAGTLMQPTRAQADALAPTPSRPWIAQRLVEGVEHSSYAVAVNGVVTAFAAYRSTHRLGGGAGYAFRAADRDVHARMLEASGRIAEALGVTGQISLDAIDDGTRTWLIECNPRATSGVHLLAGDGRLARAMSGTVCASPILRDACHNLPMMLSHGLLRPGGRTAMRAGQDVIGAPGDRLPLLGAVADTASFAVQAHRHGTTLTGATTRDIEWNGSR